MLSSRYLHLHEALSLGPMWLKQGAKVLSAAPAAAAPKAAQSASAAEAASHSHASASVARQAAMAAVGGQSATAAAAPPAAHFTQTDAANRPSEKILAESAPASTAHNSADYRTLLAGKVQPAQVVAISICPSPEDRTAGRLFSGDVGVLLNNMLAAIGLDAADVHKTSWVQDAPAFTPNPDAADIAAALPRMCAEMALAKPKAVLLLGQIFEQTEHAAAISAVCGPLPYFIVPHPARLLRQPQLKAQAWASLKQLRHALAAAGQGTD